MNDDIINASELMTKYLNIDFQRADRITTTWKKVVLRIHSNKFESENSEKRMPIGERLANNTRVIDLKNGVLLVEADHSGWIQYLRMYQNFILRGLQMEVPDLKISSLAFRLAGQNIKLSDSYENQVNTIKAEFEKKQEKQEKEIQEYYQNKKSNKEVDKSEVKSSLPDELIAKFENIKNDMLTNSKI